MSAGYIDSLICVSGGADGIAGSVGGVSLLSVQISCVFPVSCSFLDAKLSAFMASSSITRSRSMIALICFIAFQIPRTIIIIKIIPIISASIPVLVWAGASGSVGRACVRLCQNVRGGGGGGGVLR